MPDDVPNLSISVRTGEETNVDFCSSGERTRRSPDGNCRLWQTREDALERAASGGDSPRTGEDGRVALLGSAV